MLSVNEGKSLSVKVKVDDDLRNTVNHEEDWWATESMDTGLFIKVSHLWGCEIRGNEKFGLLVFTSVDDFLGVKPRAVFSDEFFFQLYIIRPVNYFFPYRCRFIQ
jgi:hypothetical protein